MKLGQDVVQLYLQEKVLTRMQRVQGHVARVVQDKTVLTQFRRRIAHPSTHYL
jgi:hypothetical protein